MFRHLVKGPNNLWMRTSSIWLVGYAHMLCNCIFPILYTNHPNIFLHAIIRRMRNGSRLLAQFEKFAVEKGYREVRLYTNNLNTSHMKFIRQHGYEIVQCVSRTLMRGSLIQWKKTLRPTSRGGDKKNQMAEQSTAVPVSSSLNHVETPIEMIREDNTPTNRKRSITTPVVMDWKNTHVFL